MGLPALLFSQHPELGQLKGKGHVSDVIRVLQSRQNEEGAFGLWSASTHAAHWPSLWAIQFMVEAKDRGQTVPPDLYEHANQWLNQIARPWGNSLADMRERAYAIYLLSRQGVQTGSLLSSLIQELNARYANTWHQDIAAAYVAASQKLLLQTDLAQKTLKAVPWKAAETSYSIYYYNLGHQGQLLYLYAKHFPELLGSIPEHVFDDISEQLNKRSYSSLSAGSLLLALTQYGEAANNQSKTPLALSALLNNGTTQPLLAVEGLLQLVDVPKTAKSVQIQQNNPTPLFYSLVESGFDRQGSVDAEVKQGLEIQREFLDLTGKPIEQVTIGQEFLVRLRVRATDNNADQIAAVDLLPGGIEPVINRVVNHPTPSTPAVDANPEASTQETAETEGGNEAEGEGDNAGDAGNPPETQADNTATEAEQASGPMEIPGFAGEPGQSTWNAEFADLRDDRVVIYGSLSRDMVTFTYRVRATNTGSYQVPAAYAEAMYNPALYAKSKASHLLIVKP